MPTISDIPDFEYIHADTPAKNAGGFRGVGEGGAIIGPPTLVNAIADALAPFGEIPLSLPLTPSKLLDVIEGRAQASAPEPVAAAPVASAPEPVPAALPQAIDGEWKMVMDTPMGAQEMTGRFQTDGDTLTGVLESPEGNQEFTGTVAGNRLKWEMKVTKPMPVTLKYDLTVEGGTLSGKVKLGMFGTAKVTGERV
jgi:carbon-monoxide dehydrogenase large subunit